MRPARLLAVFASCIAVPLLPACHGPSPAGSVESGLERPWRELFDGKTLDGWVTRGGRYDGDALWTVEDGAITGRVDDQGRGGLIYTAEPYSAFEFSCDVRMDHPFDSGIFVRMQPEGRGAQVTLDHRPDGEIAAIYSDGFLAHNPAGKDKFVREEWNNVQVRCTGFDMHLVVHLNGQLVMDHQVPEGSPGFAPRGLIGLQVHGDRDDPRSNKVQFKNVRVRELDVIEPGTFVERAPDLLAPSREAAAAGWQALLHGSDLSAWETSGTADGYRLEGGVLSIPATGSGTIHTRADHQDFCLRVDFKLAPMANSGLYLRASREAENPSFAGCEVQMLDDLNWERETGTVLLPYQLTGGLYGSLPAGWKRYRPPGEWNTYEVLYRGSRLAVALNGLVLYDVDTASLATGEHPPFAERPARGFIGFQRYGAPKVTGPWSAWFRNVLVQTL